MLDPPAAVIEDERMVTRFKFAICCGLFGVTLVASILPAAEPTAPAKDKYAAAVEALHHRDFRTRQQAFKTLADAGAAAVPAIEAAAQSGDRETRDRAISLLMSAALSRKTDAAKAGEQALGELAAIKDNSFQRVARAAVAELKEAKLVRAIDKIEAFGGTITSTNGVDLDLEGPYAVQIGNQWTGGDEGLALLADLGNVNWLSLQAAPITSEGLVHVARLKDLENLYIGYTRVSGQGLARLDFPKLKVLSLHGLALKDADLKLLPELPQLQELVLNDTLVTDEGLAHLGKYPSINKLWLENTKITDKGMVHLQRVPGLETLYLQNSRAAGPGLADLKPLSSLRFISLKHVTLQPDSLRHIAQLTQLEILGLDDTNVTDGQLADLAPLKQLRTLWLSKTRISDRGVEQILKLQALRDLYLHGSEVSETGAEKIREKIPGCNVGR